LTWPRPKSDSMPTAARDNTAAVLSWSIVRGDGITAPADKIPGEIDVEGKPDCAQKGQQVADVDRTVKIEADQANADDGEQGAEDAGALDFVRAAGKKCRNEGHDDDVDGG